MAAVPWTLQCKDRRTRQWARYHPLITGHLDRLNPVFLPPQTVSGGDDARRSKTSPGRLDRSTDGGFHEHVTGSPEDTRDNPLFDAEADVSAAGAPARVSPPARVAASQVGEKEKPESCPSPNYLEAHTSPTKLYLLDQHVFPALQPCPPFADVRATWKSPPSGCAINRG